MSSSYTPTNWQNGDIITAEKMNKIENAVAELDEKYFIEDRFITNTLISYTNDVIDIIPSSAFYNCSTLTNISCLNVTNIGNYAFYYCLSLSQISFPNCSYIGDYAFYSCSTLSQVSFPNVTSMGYAFYYGYGLEVASFPKITTISYYAFYSCSKLKSIYFLGSSIPTLGTYVFYNTPMDNSSYLGYFGSIYVPASLVASYKTATNWSAYSSRITSYTG